MTNQNGNNPSIFEKLSTAMEIISLISAGGASIPASQISSEIQQRQPGHEIQVPSQYEELPEIVKPLEDQLEDYAEQAGDKQKEEREDDFETSLLVANQPSISGGEVPDPEESEEVYESNETANQIISLVAGHMATQNLEVESGEDSEAEGESGEGGE